MIFQNLYQLNYFGKSGNANPAKMADWSAITVEKDEMSQSGVWSPEDGSCSFPSTHEVDIFYQKIGTVEDPQYLMFKISHGQLKRNKWTYTHSNRDRKQNFQAQVQVLFFEVE